MQPESISNNPESCKVKMEKGASLSVNIEKEFKRAVEAMEKSA